MSKYWPNIAVRLRVSKDLINWSGGIVVPDTELTNYTDGVLHYPKFLNKNGTDHQRNRFRRILYYGYLRL